MDSPGSLRCRLCLVPSPEQCVSITDPAVRSKLDAVFEFKLPSSDFLPNVVCTECSTKIDEFYSFHEAVRENQVQLETNGTMVLMVEVKGEPENDEEIEEADFGESSVPTAAVEEQYDNHESISQTESAVVKSAQDEDAQGEKSSEKQDDNWTIAQFFNGITCSICLEKFATFGKLKTHSRKVHGQKATITCCKRNFTEKCFLIQHIKTHLDSKQFYCEICKKSYGARQNLKVHNLQYHTKPEELPFKCDICDKKFFRESFLTAHLKRHVQVKCTVCDRTMASVFSLNVHMLKMHSEQPSPAERVASHICDICGQAYKTKPSLERHIKVQHLGAENTDRIQCPVCAKWVNNKHYLKVHIRNSHSSGENLQVTCDICQQVCANKRAFWTHKNKVHVERNLECEMCGKTFKLPKQLKEHRAAHTGEQLYTCSVCGYGSNYNGNLYTHMKNKHPVEYAEAKARRSTLMATQDEAYEAM